MVRQALSLLRCVPLQALARTPCTFANRPRQALKPTCRLRGCRAETVRISEVEGAQKEILQTARKLAEAGTIALASKGDEYV